MERNSRMKKFQFLLLDTGPVIKLFELGIWDEVVNHCKITVTKIIAEDEALFSRGENEDTSIDLNQYMENGLINIIDFDTAIAKSFLGKFDLLYKGDMHPGELQALALLDSSDKYWTLCSADAGVFKVLGVLGRAEQGISLEELLNKIGISQKLEWKYKKDFRLHYTRKGQIDSIQDKGII